MYEELLEFNLEYPNPNATDQQARDYVSDYTDAIIPITKLIFKLTEIEFRGTETTSKDFARAFTRIVESNIEFIPINLEKLLTIEPKATQKDVDEAHGVAIARSIQPYLLRISVGIFMCLHIALPKEAFVADFYGEIPNAPAFCKLSTKRYVVPLQIVHSFPRTLAEGYDLEKYIELTLTRAIDYLQGNIAEFEIKEHELVPRFPPFLVEYADRHPGIFPKETPKVDIPAQDPTKPHLIELPPSPLKITFELDESKVKETWEDFQANFEPRAKEITDLVAPSFRDIFTINIAAAEIAHLLKLTPNHVQAESIDAALTYIIYKTTPGLQWIISLNRFDQTKPTLAKLNRAHCTVGDTNRLLSLIASGSNAEELLIQYFRAIPAYLQGTSPSINLPDIFEAQPTIT